MAEPRSKNQILRREAKTKDEINKGINILLDYLFLFFFWCVVRGKAPGARARTAPPTTGNARTMGNFYGTQVAQRDVVPEDTGAYLLP